MSLISGVLDRLFVVVSDWTPNYKGSRIVKTTRLADGTRLASEAGNSAAGG